MTARLYLEDPYLREFDADVTASTDGWCLLTRTAFYPGGGGQPADRGLLSVGDRKLQVSDSREDQDRNLWHQVGRDIPVGERARGEVDWPYRYALMRHHGLMHVVNHVARMHFDGFITGVQIGPDRSRIDFKLADFTREMIPEFERHVNEAIELGLPVSSSIITEAEFRSRPALIRTLNVLPPIVEGQVRIVEIEGFDAQACGGTHVHSTDEIGRATVVKFDNKGKDNKRFYWELSA